MKNVLIKTNRLCRARRFFAAALAFSALLFASCDMFGMIAPADAADAMGAEQTSLGEGAYIALSVATDASRTALPQVTVTSEFDTFTLTGSGTDENSNPLMLSAQTFVADGTQSAYEVMNAARIPIAKGVWAFTLTATKGGASYGGSVSAVAISEGTNALSFTLSLTSFDLQNGAGDLLITVSYPADSVATVTAGLYTTGGVLAAGYEDEPVSADGTAVFEKSRVPAGAYLVIFKFYAENNVPLYVFREYAQVADSLTSISNRAIDNMENPYDIAYQYNGGSLAGGSTAPAIYARRSGDITLPQLVRTGYHFDGWTAGAEFFDGKTGTTIATGTPVSVITAGSAGMVVLYANWTPITYAIRFEANASNGISGETADLTATYDKADALTTNGYRREGYAFVGWSRTADGDAIYTNAQSSVWNLCSEQGGVVTFYAVWKESDATYTIRHFLQNITDDRFTEDASAVQELVGGVTGEYTAAVALTTYAGFTPQEVTQERVESDNSTVVKVYYLRNSYTLRYEPNAYWLDGTADPSVSSLPQAENRRYQLQKELSAAIPTRTGYVFAGWNTQGDGGGTHYALGDSLTMSAADDVTLYAAWTANTYTVIFDANGGATANGDTSLRQSFTYDTEAALDRTPFAQFAYKGYVLETDSAWTANADGTGAVYANGQSVVNLTAENGGTVTLFAKWKEAETTYTVQHYQQNAVGSSVLSDYELKDTETKGGTTGEETAAKAKTTYTGFTAQPFSQATITNDGTTTIKIYYNRNPYTLAFDGNGNTGGATVAQTFYFGVEQAIKTNGFTKTGYSFAGWATSASAEKSYGDGDSYTIGAGDETLYAKWTANNYAVALSATDATTAGTVLVTATYDAEMPAIAILPQRTGYAFAGFFTQANGSGTQYYSANGESLRSWNIASDTTLYAHWVVAGTTYTVKHSLQDTNLTTYTLSDTETLTGTTGDNTTASAKTTYAGFVTPTVTQKTIEPSGTVVEIKYDRAQYTVTFNGKGNTGGSTAAQTFYYGVAQALRANGFTRTGYAFSGWATNDTSAKQYDDRGNYTIGAANATLYATWSPLTYTVTLNANGGTGGDENVTATYDKSLPAITAPTRTGYVFVGYYDTNAATGGTAYYNANGVGTTTFATASNTTLYARWSEATNTHYTVEHYQQNIDDNDYTLISADTQDLTGKTGASTAATAKTYDGFNTPTVTQREIAADGNTVVKIYYTRKTFTVTYTAGSGITSGVSGMPTTPQTYRYGASVTVANEEPTRSGYAFNGWNLGSDTTTKRKKGEKISDGITGIAENLTLTAVWSYAAISVTVDNERGVAASKTNTDSAVVITLQTSGTYTWTIDDAALPSWATVSANTLTLTISKTAWATAHTGYASGTTVQLQITATDLTDIVSGKSYHLTLSLTKP